MDSTLRVPVFYDSSENDIAQFFHSIPRIDLSFQLASSQFDPESKSYREALLVIASVPVLWMLLWLVIYMIYSCYLCITCRRGRLEKIQKSVRPERWFTFFFSLLTMLLTCGAVFGNELLSKGLQSMNSDLNSMRSDIHNIQAQGSVLIDGMQLIQNTTIPELSRPYQSSELLNRTTREQLQNQTLLLDRYMTQSVALIRGLQQPFNGLTLEHDALLYIKQYEEYRRWGTHGLLALLILLLSLLMSAVGAKRKCFLFAFLSLVVFGMILIWSALGTYTAASVAVSDLCMDPQAYTRIYILQNQAHKDLARYYLECSTLSNPFSPAIYRVQETLMAANESLSVMLNYSRPLGQYILNEVAEPQRNLTRMMSQLLQLSSFTECGNLHRSYISAVQGLCHEALLGETTIVASLAFSGLFLIVIIFLAQAVARHIYSKRAYVEVGSQEDNIDFAARDTEMRSDNPLYYRFSQISGGPAASESEITTRLSISQPSAPPRSSPPPAYQIQGDFYSTYGNGSNIDHNLDTESNDLNRESNSFRR